MYSYVAPGLPRRVAALSTNGRFRHPADVACLGVNIGNPIQRVFPRFLCFYSYRPTLPDRVQNPFFVPSSYLGISGISIAGANASDLAQTNACGSSLPVGTSCQISVTFTPAGMGARSSTISVSSNATGSPQMVTLTGAGPDFSVAPSGSGATATVQAGQTATYTIQPERDADLQWRAGESTCSVSPSTIPLSGTFGSDSNRDGQYHSFFADITAQLF